MIEMLLARGARIYRLYTYFPPKIEKVVRNWRFYLPRWSRFGSARYYPREFNDIAIHWLLVCTRLKVPPKDLRYLIIEYIAEAWKTIDNKTHQIIL